MLGADVEEDAFAGRGLCVIAQHLEGDGEGGRPTLFRHLRHRLPGGIVVQLRVAVADND